MDWTDEELLDLGDLVVHYTGETKLFEEIEVDKNDIHKYKPARSFNMSLPLNMTTSWATSVIQVAERALGGGVRLSLEQLIQCLPVSEDVEEEGMRGVHPRTITSYLLEVGLMEEDDFFGCESINPLYTHRFKPLYPQYPNGGGLMNFVAESDLVFTMVAIDMLKLRFVKDMSNESPLKCGGYSPSVYGVITGYNYDKENMSNSYWEISTFVIPEEELIMHIPMSSNMQNANYAGIAGYAFTLESIPRNTVFSVNEEKYPFIDDIPYFATELVFEENSYPDETYCDLSMFTSLEKVTFKNGAFTNADSFYVSNPYLVSTEMGDDCFNGYYEDPTEEPSEEPTEEVSEDESGRRLASKNNNKGNGKKDDEERRKEKEEKDREWRKRHRGMHIHDGRRLKHFKCGKKSMSRVKKIKIIHISIEFNIELEEGTLQEVEKVEVPKEDKVAVNMTTVNQIIEEVQQNNIIEIEIVIEKIEVTVEELQVVEYPELRIESDEACSSLLETHWESIIIRNNMCNSLQRDLLISNYPKLYYIEIGDGSLMNLNSFVLRNNDKLEKLIIHKGTQDHGCFYNVKSVIISSILTMQ